MQIGTPRFARNAFYAFAAVLYSFLAIATSARAAVFRPESFTLANGLQIVIVQNRLSPAVSQMVWYKVGSADEPSGLSGLAHYLEHLMFRGTAEVPPGQFSRLIAGQGGNKNAFTSHDYTAYHEEIAAERLGMIMHLEADRMENLKITPETATPELDVVLSEREERTGNSPRGLFLERVQKALFPVIPYGIPVIGWRSEITQDNRRRREKFLPPPLRPQQRGGHYQRQCGYGGSSAFGGGDIRTHAKTRRAFAAILPRARNAAGKARRHDGRARTTTLAGDLYPRAILRDAKKERGLCA